MSQSPQGAAPPPIQPSVETLRWRGDIDGTLILIDQTRLPGELVYRECQTVDDVCDAIRRLCVRGAPAIGIAAAYGVCLALREGVTNGDGLRSLRLAKEQLGQSRPTAVNLFWALERMERRATRLDHRATFDELRAALLDEATAIHAEDVALCRAIGLHGAPLLASGSGVLTHCNAGALATGGDGTALAIVFTAHAAGKKLRVFVDETRPLLQGARLTSWELMRRGVECTLICDSMAAQVMREGRIQAVVVGADRIAANGDAANKIGTYGVAVLAKAHQIPFYVAAPSSTFDLALESGAQIPIEQRVAAEITAGFGRPTAPAGVSVYNPAFDVTPAELISGIVCERGVIAPVTSAMIAKMFDRS